MIYYVNREMEDSNQGSCLSLGCAGKFIAFIELLFYCFIFFSVKDYLSGKLKRRLIKTFPFVRVALSICRWNWKVVHFGDGTGDPLGVLRFAFHWREQSESNVHFTLALAQIRSDSASSDSLCFSYRYTGWKREKSTRSLPNLWAAAFRWTFPAD